MVERVRHPRLLAVARVAIYALAAVVALGVVGLALSSLGVVVAVGGVSLLLDAQVSLLALAGLVALVLTLSVASFAALYVGARRLDRAVREADRIPDPLEQLHEQYVTGRIDEHTFERRVEAMLSRRRRDEQDADDVTVNDVIAGDAAVARDGSIASDGRERTDDRRSVTVTDRDR